MNKIYEKLNNLISYSENNIKNEKNLSGLELFNIKNKNYLILKKEELEKIITELEKNNI